MFVNPQSVNVWKAGYKRQLGPREKQETGNSEKKRITS
jgi:hypothetical protein